jgi:hypothetical protein
LHNILKNESNIFKSLVFQSTLLLSAWQEFIIGALMGFGLLSLEAMASAHSNHDHRLHACSDGMSRGMLLSDATRKAMLEIMHTRKVSTYQGKQCGLPHALQSAEIGPSSLSREARMLYSWGLFIT